MKFGCSFRIFLNSAHLICRSTDISKCFSGSLRVRDNKSGLYMYYDIFVEKMRKASHIFSMKNIDNIRY